VSLERVAKNGIDVLLYLFFRRDNFAFTGYKIGSELTELTIYALFHAIKSFNRRKEELTYSTVLDVLTVISRGKKASNGFTRSLFWGIFLPTSY
jgi:hypothetical protein